MMIHRKRGREGVRGNVDIGKMADRASGLTVGPGSIEDSWREGPRGSETKRRNVVVREHTLEIETWVKVQILVMTKCCGFVIERAWRWGSLKGDREDQGQMQCEIKGKCVPKWNYKWMKSPFCVFLYFPNIHYVSGKKLLSKIKDTTWK